MASALATIHGELVDGAAVKIGELFELGRRSQLDSTRYLIECGNQLARTKASMAHGQWLPWLAANACVLGFESERTAQMLMKGAKANAKSTSHLNEPQAVALNRQIWGSSENSDPANLLPVQSWTESPPKAATAESRKAGEDRPKAM